jgi:hypothetical protein
MVLAMSDNHVDPSGNTEAFRAFTQNPPQEQAASKTPLIVGGVVAVVVVIAILIWLVA